MYKTIVKYRVTSGVLKDMILTDTFTVSIPRDNREVGKAYRGLCHWYRVLSINFEKI